jgi:hypothetical protein
MKRSVLFLTTASVLLTACDNSTHTPPKPVAEISTSMESVAPAVESQEVSQLRAENDDLRNELAKLQAVDPTVKDVYYGLDENGERVLHVVKEETNGASASSMSSTIWPLLGGMAAGAVIAKMVSSGGVSNYASHYPPARTQSFYSRDDERSERNRAYDSYRSRYQNQSQPKQAYNNYSNDRNNYSNDRNSFNQAKPSAQVVQRTVNVAPSTAVASDPQKISQYYAPTRQAAPASNDYSRNTSTGSQSNQPSSNQLSTRIVPDYKPAATQAYKPAAVQAYNPPAQTYKAPAQTYKAPAQTYKAPAQTYKSPSYNSGSRRR